MMLGDPPVVPKSGLMEEDPAIILQPVKVLIADAMGVLQNMKKTLTVLILSDLQNASSKTH